MSSPIDRLMQEVSAVSPMDLEASSPSERVWKEHANAIRNCILSDGPSAFLTWQPIISTMAACGHEDWSWLSRTYLASLSDWETRWKPAVTEISVGTPTYHGTSPPTSNALITAAHMMALFEQKVGIKAEDLGLVFEFGGGYGCLCRVLYNIGFHGDYIGYDQPVVAALARYYLAELGLPPTGCLLNHYSDFRDLDQFVGQANLKDSLFVSHWALSEVPIELRHRVLLLASNFKYIYLIYQAKFYEINNLEFFGALPYRLQGFDWQHWPIEHLGATALVGVNTQ